uniref:EGF-like domain-containing protein n=1 Tax=Panagrellus redivivus TaxID=6233 RepID=A0A7E4VCY2_PANRE
MRYVIFAFACLIEATFAIDNVSAVVTLSPLNTNVSISTSVNPCPPNFYGPKCEIPYCQPGNGYLVQLAVDKYFCNCTNTMYIEGKRCETITCRFGTVFNKTHCKCPEGMIGRFCQDTEYDIFDGPMIIVLIIVGLSLGGCMLWFVSRFTA